MLGKTCVPDLPPGPPACLPTRLLPLTVGSKVCLRAADSAGLGSQGWVAGGVGLVVRGGGVRQGEGTGAEKKHKAGSLGRHTCQVRPPYPQR